MPEISIIMPVKNAGEFLEECLDSILTQSGVDFEVLAVDDDSSDNSRQILQQRADDYNNFHVLSNPGQGIADALNHGFEKSTGTLITRMDADDVMPNNKLLHLRQGLTDDVEISTGKVKYFRLNQPLGDGFRKYEQWLNSLIDHQSFYEEIYRECPVASANWLMRKSDLERAGGFGRNYPEDYDLVFRWRDSGLKVKGVDQVTHLWRDHDSRASRNLDQYRDNRFLDLKTHWFLKSELSTRDEVFLIGAGTKGKDIARQLLAAGKHLQWFTNNTKKAGLDIYGQRLLNYDDWQPSKGTISIAAIAAPGDQLEFESRAQELGLQHGTDFFFFA